MGNSHDFLFGDPSDPFFFHSGPNRALTSIMDPCASGSESAQRGRGLEYEVWWMVHMLWPAVVCTVLTVCFILDATYRLHGTVLDPETMAIMLWVRR